MATITIQPTPPATVTSFVGDYLRACRDERRLTLTSVAAAVGISKVYLCLIEQGKRDVSPGRLREIGAAVGADLEVLKRKYRLEAARRASERWDQ